MTTESTEIFEFGLQMLQRLAEPPGTQHEASCRECSAHFFTIDATAGLCLQCRVDGEDVTLIDE